MYPNVLLKKYPNVKSYVDNSSSYEEKTLSEKYAQTRNRTGGPTMATLDFTTKPFAPSVLGTQKTLNGTW